MSEEEPTIKPIQQVIGPDGNPTFTRFGSIDDIRARIYEIKIKPEVTRIAGEFGYPYVLTEKICQTICQRSSDPANKTLASIKGDDIEMRREFARIALELRESIEP